MMSVRRWMTAAVSAAVVLTLGACAAQRRSEPSALPEMKHADWNVLRETVREYEATRVDPERKNLLFVQQKFRALLTDHADNRIGEEALYYVGRIFYDMRAYHDARLAFNRHSEFYRDSDFAPAIARMMEEMDRDQERYRAWLDESRAVSPTR